MRLLIGILVIGSLLWGGYWFVGERTVERGMVNWLDETSNSGIQIEYHGVNTTGFPNRFDTTIDDLTVHDLNARLAWSAPFLQIFALSYKPNHVIAVFPNEQQIELNQRVIDVYSDDMRASLVVEPSTSLRLDRSRIAVENLRLRSGDVSGNALPLDQTNASIDISGVFAATRQAVAQPNAHDISVALSDIALSNDIRIALDPDARMSSVIEGVKVDATMAFADEISLRKPAPRMTGLILRTAEIVWDDLSLGLSGDISADAAGFASGTLTIEATNWRRVFAILSRAGLVDPIWEGVISPLAESDGKPNDLKAPLTLRDGLVYFGPLPLGTAPRIN